MNIIANNNEGISSIELLNVINSYRCDEGDNTINHDTFVQKIIDDYGKEYIGELKIIYQGDEAVTYYDIKKEDCLDIVLGESRTVRRQVVNYINTFQININKEDINTSESLAEAARAWADNYESELTPQRYLPIIGEDIGE